MDTERVERARFAAEVRRKGTLLSDEAIADVCEALLEVIEGGVITLELHRQIVDQVRVSARRRAHAELDRLREVVAREVRRHNPDGDNCGCDQCSRFRAALTRSPKGKVEQALEKLFGFDANGSPVP